MRSAKTSPSNLGAYYLGLNFIQSVTSLQNSIYLGNMFHKCVQKNGSFFPRWDKQQQKQQAFAAPPAPASPEDFVDVYCKVENILKGSLDSILLPSPLVKIQIMDGKVCFKCKGKTLLGIVNKVLKTKSLLTSPSNVLPY